MEGMKLTTKLQFFRGLKWGCWVYAIILIVWFMCSEGCTHTKPLPPATSITLPSVQIHITEDRSSWPISARRHEVGGCASSAGEIWVLRGAWENPETAWMILGHEIQHLINWQNPEVKNPDEKE